MIIETLPNSAPFIIGEGLATKQQGITIPEIIEEATNDICYCDYECPYIETVFAEVGGEFYKNDKNSFLFKKLIAVDSIVIKLYKNGVELATISDDTYGTYYSTFAAQPLYIGFVIDWEKVLNLSGAGFYQLKAELTIIGNSSEYESQQFRLLPYSDIAADGTVRIECYNTGNILSSQFNYTDLIQGGWYQSLRILGFFGLKEPALNVDNYRNQEYKLRQIQDSIQNTFTLETNLIPALISNIITQDNILANEIYITDYNILNPELYRRISLYPSEISDATTFAKNRNQKFIIKFTDKIDNIIKSNF